jgi:hypothetical protein
MQRLFKIAADLMIQIESKQYIQDLYVYITVIQKAHKEITQILTFNYDRFESYLVIALPLNQ